MKVVLIILVIASIAGGYLFWSSNDAQREIRSQRAAMTAVKSFRTKVEIAHGSPYQSYEGEVVCPGKMHLVLHSDGTGFIADGTQYVKFDSVTYMKKPDGDWVFAASWLNIPDPCLNATNDPTDRSAQSDAMEDKANGTKGGWRSVNGDTCRQWDFKITLPGRTIEYEECIGADHLPREFKSSDGNYVAYYSDFGIPFVIDKPQVSIAPPNAGNRYLPNANRYEPPPAPKPSPDPEIPND